MQLTLPSFDSLKDTQTPSTRLYNWTLITKALDPFGIKISDDEKSLIVAGDQQILLDLLQQIKAADNGTEDGDGEGSKTKKSQQALQPTGKRGKGKPVQRRQKKCNRIVEVQAIDITALNPNKDPGKTESCLEFLLVSLSKAFVLQSKQV